MGMRHGILLLLTLFLAGCAQGHCHHKGDSASPATPKPVTGPDTADKPLSEDRVFVYKYDGSLQCGMGKAVALDVMAKSLQGITIYSSVKKRDGLMHIQVCGSITGMANVYEISASQQKRAEMLGFKKWGFE